MFCLKQSQKQLNYGAAQVNELTSIVKLFSSPAVNAELIFACKKGASHLSCLTYYLSRLEEGENIWKNNGNHQE